MIAIMKIILLIYHNHKCGVMSLKLLYENYQGWQILQQSTSMFAAIVLLLWLHDR